MPMRKRQPTHPGGILKRHYLEPLSLSMKEVADDLGVSRKTLSKIVNERGSVTPDMALRLSKAFNTSAELWRICRPILIYGSHPKNLVIGGK